MIFAPACWTTRANPSRVTAPRCRSADNIGAVTDLESVLGTQPVAFKGGPLDRQVHVWSMADVAGNEAVWAGAVRTGNYRRSRTWRTQQRDRRPVTYTWGKVGAKKDLGLRQIAAIPPSSAGT